MGLGGVGREVGSTDPCLRADSVRVCVHLSA